MMPDPLPTVIAALQAHPDLAGARVAGDLVGYTNTARWLTITITGGTRPIPGRLDAVRLDLNAYAPARDAAHRLAEAAYSACWDLRRMRGPGFQISAVELGTRPADLTDPINEAFRFVADVTIYVRKL